jgi:hypothetical protein
MFRSLRRRCVRITEDSADVFSVTVGRRFAGKTVHAQELAAQLGISDAATTYDCTATRDGRFWLVHVPAIDKYTQARNVAEVETMARDLIATVTDSPIARVQVHVRWPAEATDLDGSADTDEEGSGRRWGIHACFLDRECRDVGAPNRVYVHTPWGSLIVGERTQLWLPWRTTAPWASKLPAALSDGKSNYSRWWSPIVWHPRSPRGRG